MMRIAGFPMYDFPEIRDATDAFWTALRTELIARGLKDVPFHLVRPYDLPHFWQSPDLLIGQTCGYPFTHGLCGNARYVATPHYKTRFSHDAYHKSLILVRKESAIKSLRDARGKVCAMNMADSNSGMNVLRLEVAKLTPHGPFFSSVYETLAHRKSMQAVAVGDADLAAIDCVTFAHLERIDPALASELTIIQDTESSPSLPFIASADMDDATLGVMRDTLHTVIADKANRDICKSLLLEAVSVLPNDAYDRVHAIENQAIALGYPVLC